MITTLSLVFAMLTTPAVAGNAPLTWAGIDYGLVHMVGPGDFNEPYAIFPGYMQKWNGLVIEERMDVIRDIAGGHPVRIDVQHLVALHKAADADTQIVMGPNNGTAYFGREEVAARVASYKLESNEGLGFVMIADQLNKPLEKGCYWMTIFNMADKSVVATEWVCGEARGFGFRNYWFGTAKYAMAEMQPLNRTIGKW